MRPNFKNKRNLLTNISCEFRHKDFQQNVIKLHLIMFRENYTPGPNGIYYRYSRLSTNHKLIDEIYHYNMLNRSHKEERKNNSYSKSV